VLDRSTIKRLLTRLTIVGAGLYPMLCLGLGLGDIQVDSRLNQPLRARIEIVDVSDEEWRQIHARLAQETSRDNALTHPEVLDLVSVRTTEDTNHRHFIELKSAEGLTEPLFDLPVEVAGPTMRVIRNYSVLLDPPAADDDKPPRFEAPPKPEAPATSNTPRSSEAPSPAEKAAPAATADSVNKSSVAAGSQPPAVYVVNKYDTLERITRRLGGRTAADRKQLMQWIFEHNPEAFYGDMHHLHASAHLTLPETIHALGGGTGKRHSARIVKPAQRTQLTQSTQPAPAERQHADLSAAAAQERLAGQLDALQQTLSKMQETISTQDAEIVSLAAEVAARAPPQMARSPGDRSQTSAAVAPEEDPAEPSAQPAAHHWIAGLGLATILGIGFASLMWSRKRSPARHAPSQKQVPLDRGTDSRHEPVDSSPIGKTSQEKQLRSKPDRLRPAPDQTPTPLRSGPGPTSIPLHSGRSQTLTPLQPERDQKPLPLPEPPSDTEALPLAYFDELPEAYRAKPLPQAATPESPTEKLPQVAARESQNEPLVPKKGWSSATTMEARALVTQDGRSLINKEVAAILEKTLGNEPHRMDIRIKLLEIYHQEVLGSRAEFNSVLGDLKVDARMLTPAQRAQIDKLQRTLSDEQSDADSEFVTKVAI
jgi:Tfp pilus assembly protein FimV